MPISTEEWKTYSILIVDDELDILNSIKNTLRLKGFKVSTAISGEEGLELLKQSPAQVVMSDQKMPGGISGTEFLCKVKDLYPHTVTMVLSAFSEPEYLLGAMNEARAYYYLLKPCAQDELIQRVTQALKRYQSELEARRQFERLQALLIQSEKMATMATYAGGIAHNIRNMILPFQAPLDVIKMDTQEIKEADDTQKIELFAKYCDEIEEMVDNTNVAIDHINDLIESIMSVYKADKKESEFFDLLPIIQNAIRLQKLRHAFDNIQIHFEKTGFDFGIEALRGYLSSNIVELIKNAGDAISQKDGKAKGNVWVSIGQKRNLRSPLHDKSRSWNRARTVRRLSDDSTPSWNH